MEVGEPPHLGLLPRRLARIEPVLIDDVFATQHAHFIARCFLTFDHQADGAVTERPESFDGKGKGGHAVGSARRAPPRMTLVSFGDPAWRRAAGSPVRPRSACGAHAPRSNRRERGDRKEK